MALSLRYIYTGHTAGTAFGIDVTIAGAVRFPLSGAAPALPLIMIFPLKSHCLMLLIN